MPSSDYISSFSSLLPILVFLPFLFKKNEGPIWVVFFYSIYTFINDSIIIYRSDHDLPFNIFLYIFTLIEYLLFSFLLFSVIKNKSIRRTIFFCSFSFIIFCLLNTFGTHIKNFDSLQASIESILILSYCILYFYEQINKPQVGFIYAQYTFWIVTGLLIYLAGTFFLYVFALYFSQELRAEYWVIQHICNIFKNLLFAIAILIHAKEPKTTKSKTITEPDYQLF